MDQQHRHNRIILPPTRALIREPWNYFLRFADNRMPHRHLLDLLWASSSLDSIRPLGLSFTVPAFIWIPRLPPFKVRQTDFWYHDEWNWNNSARFNTNYGANGWLDFIFGTDTAYRKTINHIRHRTLFTTESARERFPDPPTPKEDWKLTWTGDWLLFEPDVRCTAPDLAPTMAR